MEVLQLLHSYYFQCQITLESIPTQPNQPVCVTVMSGTSYNMESSGDCGFIPKQTKK